MYNIPQRYPTYDDQYRQGRHNYYPPYGQSDQKPIMQNHYNPNEYGDIHRQQFVRSTPIQSRYMNQNQYQEQDYRKQDYNLQPPYLQNSIPQHDFGRYPPMNDSIQRSAIQSTGMVSDIEYLFFQGEGQFKKYRLEQKSNQNQ